MPHSLVCLLAYVLAHNKFIRYKDDNVYAYHLSLAVLGYQALFYVDTS